MARDLVDAHYSPDSDDWGFAQARARLVGGCSVQCPGAYGVAPFTQNIKDAGGGTRPSRSALRDLADATLTILQGFEGIFWDVPATAAPRK